VMFFPSCINDALNFPSIIWGTLEGTRPRLLACEDSIPRIIDVLKLYRPILTFVDKIKNAPAYVCL
jgi:hypothetical protein